MILKYPQAKDMVYWHKRLYPSIQWNETHVSGYKLIGIAQSDFDIYIAFTNQDLSQVWIEKTHKLAGLSGMFAKGFQQITDDEEFNKAHSFFVEQGILDGNKNLRKNV